MEIIKFYILVFSQFISTLFSPEESGLSKELILIKNIQDEIVIEKINLAENISFDIISDNLVSILVPASDNQPGQSIAIDDNFAYLKASNDNGNISLRAFDKDNRPLSSL